MSDDTEAISNKLSQIYSRSHDENGEFTNEDNKYVLSFLKSDSNPIHAKLACQASDKVNIGLIMV
jgi:hypothetical protein